MRENLFRVDCGLYEINKGVEKIFYLTQLKIDHSYL